MRRAAVGAVIYHDYILGIERREITYVVCEPHPFGEAWLP